MQSYIESKPKNHFFFYSNVYSHQDSAAFGEKLTKHRAMAVSLVIAITSDREIAWCDNAARRSRPDCSPAGSFPSGNV